MKLGRFGCAVKIAVGVLLLALIVFGLARGAVFSSHPYVGTPTPELPPGILWYLGPIPISNTMVTAWISMSILIVLFVLGTRKMKLVPRGLQNFLEWGVETLLNLVEDSVGKEKGRKFFPVIATIFLFVFVNAWMGLVPLFGAFGLKETVEGHSVLVPILRPANTDLNLTLALAIVSFVFVEYLGISQHGFFRYAGKFVNVGPLFRGFRKLFTGKIKSGLSAVFMGAIEAFVGLIEAVSELVRLLSFSFRLFGNMTAGEILLLIGFFLAPFVVPLFFYSLELLVGLIQAAVFAMLTMVFAAMATAEHEH